MICFSPANGPGRAATASRARAGWSLLTACFLTLFALAASGADTLQWDKAHDRVTADIEAGELYPTLEKIAAATGWRIFVEPDLDRVISTKFKELPPGKALPLLLGDLNFAMVPQAGENPKLLVFKTASRAATKAVGAAKQTLSASRTNSIPNELIVRLKPGASITDLAKKLGARVIGKIDSLNAYRLQFDDAAAADAARTALAGNPDVISVDSNYSLDGPPTPARLAAGVTGPPPPGGSQLQLKPPADGGRVIVGLVDTALQPLGNGLDKFLMTALSVAGAADLDPAQPSHGTSMAETILNSVQTMTQGKTSVEILPVDVYGPNTSTSTFDVAAGIAAAVNGGANVINLSLGSNSDSPFLHSVIQDAASKNIIFFGAAGNQPVTTPFYPAAYPEVNAVTAIDQGQLAPYADRGSFITLGAPGTSIISYQGQPWYTTGTSCSSAYLSGVFAGYMDANGASLTQASGFVKKNFGVTIVPVGGTPPGN